MTCDTTFSLPRGASFDLLARIPSRFADGHFAGWMPTSQVRTDKGILVANLDVQWADSDPATARTLRLRQLDTSTWPISAAQFDICLQSPGGVRLYTTAQAFHIVRGVTEHA